MHSYSERHPVPTTRDYESRRVQEEEDEKAASTHAQENQQEKSEMMKKLAGPKEKPIEKVKQRKGERVVKDPTTGLDVVIKDAKFEGNLPDALHRSIFYFFSSLDYPMGDELSPESDKPGPATQDIGQLEAVHPSHTAPSPARPGNVSFQPYLPPSPVSLQPLLQLLDHLQVGLAAAFIFLWIVFAFPQGRWWLPFTWPWFVWTTRSVFIGGIGFAAVTCASLVQRKLEKEVDRVRADMHRARGEKFAPPTPESVEWLNAFTRTIWGLINPDMFVPIADMIEGVT